MNNKINIIRQENYRENQRTVENVDKKMSAAIEQVFAKWDKKQN